MQERHSKAINQVLKVEMGQQQVQSRSQPTFTSYSESTSVDQCKALMDGDDNEWRGRRGVALQGHRPQGKTMLLVQNEVEAGLPKVKESCLSQSQQARHKTLSRDRQAPHSAMHLARVPQNLLLHLLLLPQHSCALPRKTGFLLDLH